jgi:hypothetical protein
MEHFQSSTDDFIDVQIQENLGRETLMTIDSLNQCQDWFSLFGFFAIFVILLVAGYFGPEAHSTKVYEKIDSDSTVFFYKGLTPMNRFIHMNMYFLIESREDKIPGKINASCSVTLENSKKGKKSTTNFGGIVELKADIRENRTHKIHIFSEEVIDFDAIDGKIVLNNKEPKKHLTSIVELGVGSVDHTYFQIYLRITLSLVQVIFFVSFSLRLRQIDRKMWHLEQKITLPLILITLFHTNPLFFLQVKNPSRLFNTLNKIIRSLYESYFCCFILLLLDSLRFKNRKTDEYFFIPKVIWAIVIFIVSIIRSITADSRSHFLHLEESKADYYEKMTHAFIGILYLINVVLSIIKSYIKVDSTEKFKSVVYMITCTIVLALLLASDICFNYFGIFENTSIPVTALYALQNLFSLMMTYFHWPYEILEDQEYFDGVERVPPPEFFANSDIELI